MAGVSLLSRSTVPDPRQPFWRWLASPAGTSSPKGAGWLQTAPSVQCDGKRAAEAEANRGSVDFTEQVNSLREMLAEAKLGY